MSFIPTPEVCQFYCTNTRTVEQTREWLIHRRWQLRNIDELGFLAVVRKEDNQIIGLVALQPLVGYWMQFEGEENEFCRALIVELSYAIGRQYQRQGYAAEACRALIDYGFNEMRISRLSNDVMPENVPSAMLCKKLGFRRVKNIHPEGREYTWILDNPYCTAPA